MNKRNILYTVISAVCVIAIVVGVYYQIFGAKQQDTNIVDETNNIANENGAINPETLKEEFNNLFDNYFYVQDYDTDSITKIKGLEDQDIIYAAYNIQEEKDKKYSVNINLPVFNVDGDIVKEFNSITQSVFANKANEVLSNSQQYTIYNVDYVGYLNDTILSLVIKSTLKEGNNPQRIIVQTYNYDITTGEKVSLNDILEKRQINVKDVNEKIENQVEEANKQAEAVSTALAQTGQRVYKRDINNAMYVTDNVNYFFIGQEGQIYIVYPYGNADFTSEIDIIKI